MLKPVCVPCQRFFKPHKNGLWFVEGMPAIPKAIPGTAHPEQWQPYKLWCGDEWMCNGCGSKIVVGTGVRPHRERHHDDFQDEALALGAMLQINDC